MRHRRKNILQQKDMPASLTCNTLSRMKTDDAFKEFWEIVQIKAAEMGTNEPAIPRKRKAPKMIEVGQGDTQFAATPEEHYRAVYLETFDLIIACIRDHFDQPGYRIYHNIEKLLLRENFDQEFDIVMHFYGDDFNYSLLKSQFQLLHGQVQQSSHQTVSLATELLLKLGRSSSLLSEVVKLVSLILVMPATNATSERSFSALRRVKTYLRSSMNQSGLNHLMIFHVHKEFTDNLDLIACANDFVAGNEHRLRLFGSFQ